MLYATLTCLFNRQIKVCNYNKTLEANRFKGFSFGYLQISSIN